jgi:hypothetical protein
MAAETKKRRRQWILVVIQNGGLFVHATGRELLSRCNKRLGVVPFSFLMDLYAIDEVRTS